MAITVYPLNNIDYTAEDVAIYNSTRTSGIYAGEDFAISLTGADNTISVDAGIAWMRLSKFHGVAAALKAKTSVDMGIPDATYPRIDALVLQFDANKNGAEIVSKSGTASSDPKAPALSQTEALYELHLCHVLRNPGAASITAADVTDLRMNETYCGLMADAVTRVDTAAINAQISALIQKLKDDLAAVDENSYYASKDYVDTRRSSVSVTLPASGWANNLQTVAVENVTADPAKSDVIASPAPEDAVYTAYCESGVRLVAQLDGAITFKCSEVPTIDLTVYVMVMV